MRVQLRNHLLEFAVTVITGLCIYCSNIYLIANNSTYKYYIELWNYGEQILHLLYPLVFTFPFCLILFYEKNNSYWKNIFNRIKVNQYMKKRILITLLMSMVAMLLVSFGSMLFAYWIGHGNIDSNYEPISSDFYGWYQLKNPISYAFILSCWRAILAALYTALAIGITLICNNIFIAMTGAFIYSIAENYITTILHVPELSITTSFYPNRLVSEMISFPKLMVGPSIMVVIIIILYVCYNNKIKKTLMD